MDQYWTDNMILGMHPFTQLHLYGINGKVSGNLACIGEIKHACVVLCGPRGCGFHYKYNARTRHRPFYELECVDLRDKEVVFGAEEKICSLVREIDNRDKPELIFLLPSVVSDIMNEDLAGIATKLQPQVQARLVYVRSQAFSHMNKNNARRLLKEKANQACNAKASPRAAFAGCGYVEVMDALVEQVMEPQEKAPLTVNIETFVWGYNGQEKLRDMAALLNRMGIEVNCWLPAADLQELRRAPRASLNIVRRRRWACNMERRFGTPFLHIANMQEWHGMQGITEFYEAIGEQLDCLGTVHQVLEQEREQVQERLLQLRAELAQYRFSLIVPSMASVPEQVMCFQRDYGLPLQYIFIVEREDYQAEMGINEAMRQKFRARAEESCRSCECRAELVENPTPERLRELACRTDYLLCNGAPKYLELGVRAVDTKFDRAVWTYQEFLNVVEELLQSLKNMQPPGENLLLSKVKLDKVDYPLRTADTDSYGAKAMYSKLWRQRKV